MTQKDCQNLVTQKSGETRDVLFNFKKHQKNKQAGLHIRNFLRVATLAQRTGHIRFKRDCFFSYYPTIFKKENNNGSFTYRHIAVGWLDCSTLKVTNLGTQNSS